MNENVIAEKFLPLGTVVLLKEATKRLMITGYCVTPKSDPDTMYDYTGCLYPEGYILENKMALFNHDQIAKVVYMGPDDSEQREFIGVLKESFNHPEVLEASKEATQTAIFDLNE